MIKNKWIDEEKYDNYIKNHPYKHMVEKIIKNTQYFTTKEVVNMVKSSLIRFISEHPKYNLYVEPIGNKIGSEHFLLLQLEDILNPVQTLTRKDSPTNNHPIIIVDDAIYSSLNMCGAIDIYEHEISKHISNDFYCIVGITTRKRPEVVESSYAKDIYYDKCLEEFLPENMFTEEIKDYPEIMNKEFYCQTHHVVPCFFEHKIANEWGTYSDLYRSIIRDNLVSRECIDKITNEEVVDFFKRLY